MGGEGFTFAMISSIKNNDRKNKKVKPFKNFTPNYLRGKSLFSKKMTFSEKKALLLMLKSDRKIENKQKAYKIIISMTLAIIFIIGFVSILKLFFF